MRKKVNKLVYQICSSAISSIGGGVTGHRIEDERDSRLSYYPLIVRVTITAATVNACWSKRASVRHGSVLSSSGPYPIHAQQVLECSSEAFLGHSSRPNA